MVNIEFEFWTVAQLLTDSVMHVVVGFGCFHPSTHVSGDEDGLLPGKPFHAQQNETGQGDSWGFGWHVWTDARCVLFLYHVCLCTSFPVFVVRGHLKISLFSQAVGLELARGLFRTGTRLLWDAIAPTHSSMATVATLPLHLSHSLTWGPSLLLSPTR